MLNGWRVVGLTTSEFELDLLFWRRNIGRVEAYWRSLFEEWKRDWFCWINIRLVAVFPTRLLEA